VSYQFAQAGVAHLRKQPMQMRLIAHRAGEACHIRGLIVCHCHAIQPVLPARVEMASNTDAVDRHVISHHVRFSGQ
jgi:hypothetical protein